MNLSAITVSFPLDEETYGEVQELCKKAAESDGHIYHNVMNLPVAKSYETRGFYVLVYDDDKNELVGAGTAIDIMGLNTYEWSLLVAPMYRQLGIGKAVLHVLRDGMDMRESDGELALMIEGSHFGRDFLQRNGYLYSFSEATLEAHAEILIESGAVSIRPFMQKDTEALVSIFSEAFGDMREESLDLIEFNSTTAGLKLWTVELDGEVVGTVTTRKEGEVQWVSAFAVAPNKQGHGIGTQILNWVKDYTIHSGEKTISLDVEIENSSALRVYEKAGFIKSYQLDYFVRVM
ncbi:GNAT family N-acetyltransferase [Lysinibacillus sp. 2017]|uniref:GNAT family N-acetyltransferase n=1 Tax=unclassified Lysinibacillus TaxID=2636778 RepID=UPI000D5264BB|nr:MULTISPECIES: GNAT family N-acetyltransferase [unclassified Lysinibacillus]AWE06151.1 GNAT family N-acetyltransferase [Lysinibacillus sp. 2017]TGN35194.1 GNAT family N-acetyltransferase [Lysinibacillus sp. S2017]